MFYYKNNLLHVENVSVEELSNQYGTPFYVYSKELIEENIGTYHLALKKHYSSQSLVCYSVKANSNLYILKMLKELGSGFDVVSAGEIYRLQQIKADMQKVVFSGVGKREDEIKIAIEADILCFNVESMQELQIINKIAGELNKKANISIRINPNIDPKTHEYIATGLKESKFGIDLNLAIRAYEQAKNLDNLNIIGLDCHIGSQITELEPFEQMLDSLLNFIEQVKQKGIELQYLNIGGGVGVCYENESIFAINDFIAMVSTKLKDANLNIILEPGRSIIANAGGLITKTILTKSSGKKEFVVVDAAMTELIRPTLYGAKHRVWQSQLFPKFGVKKVDIVGAVCECGDFLAQDCEIAVDKTSLFAIGSCGAYASTMGSNYNSRLKPCEIMIDGDKSIVIRKSEEYEDLIKNEIDFI